MRPAALGLPALLWLSLACGEGPTFYVGDAPQRSDLDAGMPDAQLADRDEQADGDDDEIACSQREDCTSYERVPYCDQERRRCVECLEDSHCDDDEQCDQDDGECEER